MSLAMLNITVLLLSWRWYLKRILGKQNKRESICGGGVLSLVGVGAFRDISIRQWYDPWYYCKRYGCTVKNKISPDLIAWTFAGNLPFSNRSLSAAKLWNWLVPCRGSTGLICFLDMPHYGEPAQSPHKCYINGNTKELYNILLYLIFLLLYQQLLFFLTISLNTGLSYSEYNQAETYIRLLWMIRSQVWWFNPVTACATSLTNHIINTNCTHCSNHNLFPIMSIFFKSSFFSSGLKLIYSPSLIGQKVHHLSGLYIS